jgi:hypothetical protein
MHLGIVILGIVLLIVPSTSEGKRISILERLSTLEEKVEVLEESVGALEEEQENLWSDRTSDSYWEAGELESISEVYGGSWNPSFYQWDSGEVEHYEIYPDQILGLITLGNWPEEFRPTSIRITLSPSISEGGYYIYLMDGEFNILAESQFSCDSTGCWYEPYESGRVLEITWEESDLKYLGVYNPSWLRPVEDEEPPFETVPAEQFSVTKIEFF